MTENREGKVSNFDFSSLRPEFRNARSSLDSGCSQREGAL